MRNLFTFLVILLLPVTAFAHKPSDSYLKIIKSGNSLEANWEIALKDLEYVVGIDKNKDEKISSSIYFHLHPGFMLLPGSGR